MTSHQAGLEEQVNIHLPEKFHFVLNQGYEGSTQYSVEDDLLLWITICLKCLYEVLKGIKDLIRDKMLLYTP